MNTATKITMVRLVLIPAMIFFYLASFIPYGKLIAFGIFVIAACTDFVDGYIARKFNQVTTMGGFLDSIADKILVVSAMLLVVTDGTILAPYGVIAAIIIVAREFIVSALRQIAMSKGVDIRADMAGKIKANFQMFSIAGFMLVAGLMGLASETATDVLWIVSASLLGVAVGLTVWSGINYCVKNRKVFK